MKKFIVDTGDKKYKVEANDAEHATKLVKIVCKDEASALQTVNALLEDERAAVDAYNVALENLKGKIPDESYAAIKAIRNDENRHIENLQAVVNGNVTEKNLEDSVKDSLVARLYKSALGNPNHRRVQLLLNGKEEVASLTQNEARALAAKISELANSATN